MEKMAPLINLNDCSELSTLQNVRIIFAPIPTLSIEMRIEPLT
tara:strand:- start:183 stop:311 length:129 start_codon:yes stop_codon:yes gene_type:complete